jgi:DNA invertase Pin-like site-specific DNA recombinase
MMPGWIETRTYIDDGASGSNFQRQGFIDMMEDVRSGVINLVLVKDLSRFGRNYLEAGRYLEVYRI